MFLVGLIVTRPFIRILSDLHYGDRASAVLRLSQLAPLLAGADEVIFNGDTLDTRPGPHPEVTVRLQAELKDFERTSPVPLRYLTGNHDPDISTAHLHELAGGVVLLTHGDIAFEDLVPWGGDAALARRLVAHERSLSPAVSLEQLLAAHRRAAYAIPQRHQAEPRRLKYLASYLADTVWPPDRIPRILRAWVEMPGRMAGIARTHRPGARFIVTGHTHRPGIWRRPDGRVIINTGSFCPPSGFQLVDVTPERLLVRRIERRNGSFHPGAVIAEFALAAM